MDTYAYVGTFTRFGGEGIYTFLYDRTRHEFVLRDVVEAPDPSYLARSPRHAAVFAAHHVDEFYGTPGGGVSCFSIARASGRLTLVSRVVVPHSHPAYISLDATENTVLVASTLGGGVSSFPVSPGGTFGPPGSLIPHEGRLATLPPTPPGELWPQLPPTAPLPHCILTDPSNRFALVTDVLLNQIFVYRFHARAGRLSETPVSSVTAKPGAGPRHLAFHPRLGIVYVVNERDSTVTTYSFSAARPVLHERQTVRTRPPSARPNMTADLQLTPDGRFLYASNRGDDTIAAFRIRGDGWLVPIQTHSVLGEHPRHLAVAPDGSALFVANQYSDSIVGFEIAPDGLLIPLGAVASVPAPSCILFAPSLGAA